MSKIVGPQPGPQTEVLLRPEYETLYGGAKYGGKTFAGRLFLLKGNPDEPQGKRDTNTSYIYNPNYRALVLRRNITDLEDWITEARKLFQNFGGEWAKSDRIFQFPHPLTGKLEDGAKIIVGHLAEEDAFQKYTGREFQRVLIEELSFIPTLDLYQGVSSCCRTTFREMRPQVMVTTNPIGVGWQWIKKRWLYDPKTNERVPPKTRIVERVFDPITQEWREVDRVFIPAGVRDNKIGLAEDPGYVARLMILPELMRRAYLDGDVDIQSGDQFFSEFRPNGPMGEEPANALHCVASTSVEIEPWALRWASCDWGYNHPCVILWCAQCESDSRNYFYREIKTRFMGSYDLGVMFAKASLPDLTGMTPPIMTLWMSPDAFSNRDASRDADGMSIVDRFAQGVRTVLGSKSVYVPDTEELKTELEKAGIASDNVEDFFARKALAEQANVVIRRAPNQRVAGFQYMREMMSFRDVELGLKSFDPEYAKQLILNHDGLAKYLKYCEAHNRLATRPSLPRLRIFSDKCPALIDGIQRAVFADDMVDMRKTNADQQTGEGGDDAVDCARYGCAGFQRMLLAPPPSIERQRKVRDLTKLYGGTPLLYQALEALDQKGYNKSAEVGIRLHRQATHPLRRFGADRYNKEHSGGKQKSESDPLRALAIRIGPYLD